MGPFRGDVGPDAGFGFELELAGICPGNDTALTGFVADDVNVEGSFVEAGGTVVEGGGAVDATGFARDATRGV